MKATLTGIIASTLLFINVVFWCSILFVLTFFKIIIPFKAFHKIINPFITFLAENWIMCNKGWMSLTQPTKWDIQLPDTIKNKGWYFVSANHQSWVDILILQKIFNRKIPFLKFFLKQELIKVPIMGQAWWALDFPFMKRFSKSYLEKHPEMKGKDLETTKQACEKFKEMPTSVMNFLEGTRLTPSKHEKQQSPFKYLLKPKSGGFAFALNAMGDSFNSVIDVTIVYPDGIPTFGEFLQGKVKRIIVRAQELVIPKEFINGDYENDPAYRENFQKWINDMWVAKDAQIEGIWKEIKSA